MKEPSNSSLTGIEPKVRVAPDQEFEQFDKQMGELHYLGAGKPVGDYMRQIVQIGEGNVALLVWGPACYLLKDRDLWLKVRKLARGRSRESRPFFFRRLGGSRRTGEAAIQG
jgi:hypothetical protein